MTVINKLNKINIDAFAIAASRENALDEYQSVASGSAIYPGHGSVMGLWYCITKLNGEAGEAAEHIGKAFRDDGLTVPIGSGNGVEFIELTPERRDLIIKEVGDCLWYLSAICRELGITMSAAALRNLEKLYDRQQRNALSGSGDNR
jgi:NTP pyrophosphatase (non-canonical NTP hydrolase)